LVGGVVQALVLAFEGGLGLGIEPSLVRGVADLDDVLEGHKVTTHGIGKTLALGISEAFLKHRKHLIGFLGRKLRDVFLQLGKAESPSHDSYRR
jgi:hypothetical protein